MNGWSATLTLGYFRLAHHPPPIQVRRVSNELVKTGPAQFCEQDERHQSQVRAEGQQAAVAILHDKLSRVPRHVGKSSRELHAFGRVLGIKRVCIFDMEIRIEQFIVLFIGIGRGWRCAAEVNGVLVAGHNGINRRVLPCSQTFETKLVFVIGERSRNIGGEEQRYDLTDHGAKCTAASDTADESGRAASLPVTRTAFLKGPSGRMVGEWEVGFWFARDSSESWIHPSLNAG
jgi:hypothetical protein